MNLIYQIKFNFYNNEVDNHTIVLQNRNNNKGIKTPFHYSLKDFVWEFMCLHRCKSKGKTSHLMKQRHEIFMQEVKYFKAELDWAAVLKSLRDIKSIFENKLDDNQHDLSNYINERNLSVSKHDSYVSMHITRSKNVESILNQQMPCKLYIINELIKIK